MKSIITMLCVTGLAACGGGGDSVSSNPAPAAPNGTAPVVTNNPPAVTQTGTATVVTPAPSQAGTVTSATSCNVVNFQADILREVNAARAQARSCGTTTKPSVAPVAWDSTLFVAAAGHSQDMALRNFFAHVNLNGKTAGDRAISAGYNFSALGENIAAGQRTVSEVMKDWLDSPGHCDNIMAAVYTEIAVACVSTSRFEYPTYWSMELAKPR